MNQKKKKIGEAAKLNEDSYRSDLAFLLFLSILRARDDDLTDW